MLGGCGGEDPRAERRASGVEHLQSLVTFSAYSQQQTSLSELRQRLPPRDSRLRRVSFQGCMTASAPCFNVCR